MNGSEKTIFLRALEETDPRARNLYLDEACGENTSLRASIDALLSANEQPDNPLDRPPVALPEDNLEISEPQLIGKMIGPYRLMEQIGEGGFGLVFVARQEHPVRRDVALKVVKPGTGSKEIIARFEAERQAVAMMDHPNIASVFDAGVTADGRPYFVMELVRGIPISEFADLHRMTIPERLRLFVDVCSAVQHAHQKGVIHRDIKPSNVMVTLHDGKPVVKVIDFGVAKAIGQTLTDRTIYTRFFSMIGTPLYMSPEQAEMSGLDVDTRSDIYSLGVMLYELLSGAPPFDRHRLDSAGLDEMRRIIREEEPPRPSKRLTTLGASITTVSASRRIEPNRLSSSLRGDLDWIVMKALEKDRSRRYDSAAAMAVDVTRYLEQQPIEAPTFQRFLSLARISHRHRAALLTGAILLFSLLMGTAASLWQMRRAMDGATKKNKLYLEIEQFSTNITRAMSLIATAETHADANQWLLAKTDFDTAVQQQPSYYLPWISRAQFFARLSLWNAAADDYAKAVELNAPTDTPQWWGAAALLAWTDHHEALAGLAIQLESQLAFEHRIESWQRLRSGLATDQELSRESYGKIAAKAESWLAEMNGPRPREMPPGGRPPPPRRPAGRPDFQDRPAVRNGQPRRRTAEELPRPVCEYITGLAHLRAGDFEQAIRRLQQSGREHWPSVGLIHAPLALALQATDRKAEALLALDRSKIAIEQTADTMLFAEGRPQQIPWFDFIELLQIHREATLALTGAVPAEPGQLDQLRQQSLQKLEE